jgi:hypothetical protein
MKIPKSIKIGGIVYNVSIVTMGDDLGQTDFRTSEIRISKDLNDNQKLASFIHEVIHCVNTQLTEEQVDYLALSINQIIVDNKLF